MTNPTPIPDPATAPDGTVLWEASLHECFDYKHVAVRIVCRDRGLEAQLATEEEDGGTLIWEEEPDWDADSAALRLIFDALRAEQAARAEAEAITWKRLGREETAASYGADPDEHDVVRTFTRPDGSEMDGLGALGELNKLAVEVHRLNDACAQAEAELAELRRWDAMATEWDIDTFRPENGGIAMCVAVARRGDHFILNRPAGDGGSGAFESERYPTREAALAAYDSWRKEQGDD